MLSSLFDIPPEAATSLLQKATQISQPDNKPYKEATHSRASLLQQLLFDSLLGETPQEQLEVKTWLKALRITHPKLYIQLLTRLLPKEIQLNNNDKPLATLFIVDQSTNTINQQNNQPTLPNPESKIISLPHPEIHPETGAILPNRQSEFETEPKPNLTSLEELDNLTPTPKKFKIKH